MSLDRDATSGARGGENYYEVLGLAPGATAEEIEAAYEDLSAMFAASRVPASRQEYARKQRTRLAAAYAILGDPTQRAAYEGRQEDVPAGGLNPPLAQEPSAAEPIVAFAPGAAMAGTPDPSVRGAATVAPAGPSSADPGMPPGPVTLPWEAPVGEPALSESLATATPVARASDGPLAAAPPQSVPLIATGKASGEDEETLDYVADTDEDDADLDYDDGADEDGAGDEDTDLDYEDVDEAPEELPPAIPPVAHFVPSASPTTTAGQPGTAFAATGNPADMPAGRRASDALAGVRVEPARSGGRPGGAPSAPAPRAGGVALPTRREAALITARQAASATPEPPPMPSRVPSAPRRPVARPTRAVEYEEDIRPRGRMAPPAPARRKRSRKATNQFAYQVMVLVIALVLIVGTAAQVLSGTITSNGATTGVTPTANAGSLVTSGNALVAQGNWTLAEQVFQQALQVQPTNVNAMLGLVHVYEGRHNPGDSGQAQTYAQQIIKTDPNSAAAKEAIGVLTSLSLTPQGSPSAAPAAGATAIPATGAPAATPPGATSGAATPKP